MPETTDATGITATTATLNGVLEPSKPTEPGAYYFRYGPGQGTCEESTLETPYTEAEVLKPEAVTAPLENLLPATSYVFCLVAESRETGELVPGASKTFVTPTSSPTVTSEAVVIVGATTALVSAEVSPGGLPATYYAEFVSEAAFAAHGWSAAVRQPETPGELPASSATVTVSEELDDLESSTGYRVRFVVKNALGTAVGPEDTLTTAAGTGATLPDSRVDELVSVLGAGEPYYPPTPIGEGTQAEGENVAPGFRTDLLFRAAANGEAIAYVAEPAVAAGTGEIGPGEGNQWLAHRTPAGWQTEDITPAENVRAVYGSFSEDLDTGIYEGDITPLTSEVEPGCAALYVRASAGEGSFRPLFTRGTSPRDCGHPLFAGAASGESHIIFQSEAALTPGSEEASNADLPPGRTEHDTNPLVGQGCLFGCNLYEATAGKLEPVNILSGKAVPSATFGGYANGETELPDFSNAISTDGSRIFWTDTQAGPDFEHVYVDESGVGSVPVSGSQSAEYWTATPDGHYAYYTEGGALWQFNTELNTRAQLTESEAEVQGVIGVNQTGEDGSYVYFVANGVLTSVPNSHGERATQGDCPAPTEESAGCDLYLLHEGSPIFVARLSGVDDALLSDRASFNNKGGDWQTDLGERLAEITPDGRNLVFESIQSLTGYDNAGCAESGNPIGCAEVYVYDAETAQLSCASCSPTGAPPSSGELHSNLPVSKQSDTYMRRWVSETGSRVFFDSSQRLTPQDTGGAQNVYEWERPATRREREAHENTCTPAAASPLTGGCTFLLSGGAGNHDSFLVDADATGNDVFFEHVGPLGGPLGHVEAPVGQNELYDARVDGGFPTTAVGCTHGSCVSAAASPAEPGLIASMTFAGIGNFPPVSASHAPEAQTRAQALTRALKTCKRDKKKQKRRACERQARRRYGPTRAGAKADRASYNRRTHS